MRVTDPGGKTATDDATVSITNTAPSGTLEAPDSAPAGFAFTLAVTGATDPSAADQAAGFTYAFDCGKGYGDFGPSATASCTVKNGRRAERRREDPRQGRRRQGAPRDRRRLRHVRQPLRPDQGVLVRHEGRRPALQPARAGRGSERGGQAARRSRATSTSTRRRWSRSAARASSRARRSRCSCGSWTSYSDAGSEGRPRGPALRHFANSVARLSRMTVTLIWPGYSISDSISRAISCERSTASSSVTSVGLTITRTSRPAWSA